MPKELLLTTKEACAKLRKLLKAKSSGFGDFIGRLLHTHFGGKKQLLLCLSLFADLQQAFLQQSALVRSHSSCLSLRLPLPQLLLCVSQAIQVGPELVNLLMVIV